MAYIQSARAMGISGTPSFLVNDRLVVGNSPDEVRQAIEDELARAAP
jgi:protein-disulfide isomerase